MKRRVSTFVEIVVVIVLRGEAGGSDGDRHGAIDNAWTLQCCLGFLKASVETDCGINAVKLRGSELLPSFLYWQLLSFLHALFNLSRFPWITTLSWFYATLRWTAPSLRRLADACDRNQPASAAAHAPEWRMLGSTGGLFARDGCSQRTTA